jgi:hypothetical protein
MNNRALSTLFPTLSSIAEMKILHANQTILFRACPFVRSKLFRLPVAIGSIREERLARYEHRQERATAYSNRALFMIGLSFSQHAG